MPAVSKVLSDEEIEEAHAAEYLRLLESGAVVEEDPEIEMVAKIIEEELLRS